MRLTVTPGLQYPHMTEHGTAVLAEIRAARGTEAGRVFGRLTSADRADLARLLSQLRD